MQVVDTLRAPKAIGPYSQAIKINNVVYFSGQIPLDPATMNLITTNFKAACERTFENLKNVAEEAGGSLQKIVKITIYLTDLAHFEKLNEVMMQFFSEPYPARTTVSVTQLPKSAPIEIDAIMVI